MTIRSLTHTPQNQTKRFINNTTSNKFKISNIKWFNLSQEVIHTDGGWSLKERKTLR